METDVAVIGAGIVGMATALALTRARPELRIVVVDKENGVARHQTGRNSGVIHSGIYYRPGSLKARLARAGNEEMVRFCQDNGVPYERTGKVIVATAVTEIPALDELARRGRANGVPVERLDVVGLREREPYVAGLRALWVPTAGICDYTAVTVALARLAGDAGCTVWTEAEVLAIDGTRRTPVVTTRRGEVRARCVVNCAGLHADVVARMAGVRPQVRLVPFRGEYQALGPGVRDLVRGLVYPVPDMRFPFLGVHLTRMVAGGVLAGPSAVLALAREGYRRRDIDPTEAASLMRFPGLWHLARKYGIQGAAEVYRSLSRWAYARGVARLLPGVRAGDLSAAPAGVRAQALLPDGSLADDFLFEETEHAVHVLNAPSPAATAALPIGRDIAKRVLSHLDLPG